MDRIIHLKQGLVIGLSVVYRTSNWLTTTQPGYIVMMKHGWKEYKNKTDILWLNLYCGKPTSNVHIARVKIVVRASQLNFKIHINYGV